MAHGVTVRRPATAWCWALLLAVVGKLAAGLRNVDDERLGAALRLPQSAAAWAQGGGPPQRVLWFAPVSYKSLALTARNVAHLRKGPVDIFLAHYDGTSNLWQREQWYNGSVRFYVDYQATKVDLVHRELVYQDSYKVDGYQWYWVADDNIDFTSMNVREYLMLADESRALIVQPAVEDEGSGVPSHELVNVFRQKLVGIGTCLYRLTDFVEVMSPMFRPLALAFAYDLHLSGAMADWGMDLVWCRYVASRARHSPDRACAVVDATPMVKLRHDHSYNFHEAMLDGDRVRTRFLNFTQRSLDSFMRRRPGDIEWCQPANSSLGLVKLNFTSLGLDTWERNSTGQNSTLADGERA